MKPSSAHDVEEYRKGNPLMSGPIVRTGATPEYWSNWDNVFGKSKKKSADKSSPKKAAAKKKTASKKAPAKKVAAASAKKAAKKKSAKKKS